MARLVVVSNRVAVPSRHGANRAGGLAVAIRPVIKRHPGIWFGWSGGVAAASNLAVRTLNRLGLLSRRRFRCRWMSAAVVTTRCSRC